MSFDFPCVPVFQMKCPERLAETASQRLPRNLQATE
jgi:hypothetical protein